MATMNMIEAINDAMDVALERDKDVTVLGEDVGFFGGVFRATAGLQKKYGKTRVFDTPITECGIVGVAVGMAAYGLRPVPEIQFADYIYPALDQLVSEAARLRYRSAGEFPMPITVRSPFGGGIFGGQTHSQSPEAIFTHICGLKTVIPSTPYDAKGLLLAAIEDDHFHRLQINVGGLQHGTAYGNPASFRQKREGLDKYVEGYGQRIEYDGKSDKVELFTQARMKRGQDEVRGNYISYDAKTEFFQVLGGGKEAAAPGKDKGRVRAVIQPKAKPGKGPASPAPLPLQGAESIAQPRAE